MIRLENIHKSYKENHAVNGISIHVKKGEFYSLLGPNGAGKTSTINIISTLIHPDKGNVFIDGKNLSSEAAVIKNLIGVVPQEISLYEDLSAYDNLLFFGSLYPVTKSELKNSADRLLKEFGLTDRKNDRISSFSGGMKRRINIAVALMHDPSIIIMDEPTVGIDPQSRNNIYDAIQRLRQQGKTILYTTHYMEEAEKFSDRIGIIDHGKIVAEGTLGELLDYSQTTSSLEIVVAGISDIQSEALRKKWNFTNEGNKLLFSSINLRSDLAATVTDLAELGCEIQDIEIQKAGLETVFLSLTGKNLRD